jgi:two-component system, response regulator PdtaR
MDQTHDQHSESNDSKAKAVVARRAAMLPEHPQRLLLADDEHLVAIGIAGTLEELGYTVVGPANDGQEAIELCRIQKPDLALLDIRMGGLDGLDAAKVLFHDLATPVIIFSAYSDEKYIQSGSGIGVFSYLLKPILKEQLQAAITVAWSRYLAWAEQNAEIAKLRTRLEDRKIIEQAKWLIVQHKDLPEPQAMKMLQTQARNTRRPLVEVARGVIESHTLLNN